MEGGRCGGGGGGVGERERERGERDIVDIIKPP